jgi:hypothetical protein
MRILSTSVFFFVVAAWLFVITLDWFGGCGELFMTPAGPIHGECLGRELLFHLLSGGSK